MKAALMILLWAISVSATAQTADDIYKQACGPISAKFIVEQVPGKPPVAPEPGEALVYFIQKENAPTLITRLGLDGAWVGVLQHDSYIFASVAPGEHHACAATSNRKRPEVELLNFTAEAGKTYYYLLRGISGTEFGATMEFVAANRDEARYLIASDPQSKATPVQ
jgi:hypothetical protein